MGWDGEWCGDSVGGGGGGGLFRSEILRLESFLLFDT